MASQPTPVSPGTVQNAATQTAGQQQGYNVSAQAGSQYGQATPYGSTNYVQYGTGPGGVPLYTAISGYSPTEQGLFNQYTGTQATAGLLAPRALAQGNYGLYSPTQQIGDMTTGRTGQLMNTWLTSQEPFWTTQTQQLDTQLRNQGLQPGNPNYDTAMRQLTTNQGLAVGGAASQFEPQAFSQATTLFGLPLTVAQQLAQWGAPVGSPLQGQTSNLPGLQAPNVTSALQAQSDIYNNYFQQQQSEANATNQMIAGLLGAGVGAGGNILGAGMFGNALGSALRA